MTVVRAAPALGSAFVRVDATGVAVGGRSDSGDLRGDVPKVATLYAENASIDITLLSAPQVSPHLRIKGKNNIFAFWQRSFAESKLEGLKLIPLEITVYDGMVHETGRYFVTIYLSDSLSIVESGGYFLIWKKYENSYRIIKHIVWSYGKK